MSKLLLALIASVALSASPLQARTLTYGTEYKSSHNLMPALKHYFSEIEKSSDGSLDFKILADGTVISPATATKSIQQGLVDMGSIIPFYSGSVFPNTALLSSLPLRPSDSLIETGVINELFYLHCDGCQDEWASAKILPLAMFATSPYYLQCRQSLGSIKDLHGKRIQSSGEYAALTDALGGLPVGLTTTEFYAALNQGTLDCLIGSAAWLDTYGLKDVVKIIMNKPLGVFRPMSQMSISMKKWDQLSDSERHSFMENVPRLIADSAYSYLEQDEDARASAAEHGIGFIPPLEGFDAIYERVGQEGMERFLELAEKRQVNDADQLLERYLALQEEWTRIVSRLSSRDEYEAALRERIFSKAQWPAR